MLGPGCARSPPALPLSRATRYVFVCTCRTGVMICGGVTERRPLGLAVSDQSCVTGYPQGYCFIMISTDQVKSTVAQSRRTTGALRRDCGRRECDARRGSGAPPCEGGERGACAPKKREEFWNRRCRDPRLGKSATPAVPRALSRVRRSAVYWGRVASQHGAVG